MKNSLIDFNANTLKRRIIKNKKEFIQYSKEIIYKETPCQR